MSMPKSSNMSRRIFMTSLPGLFVGSHLFSLDSLTSQTPQTGRDLKEELTQEEVRIAEKSLMAKDIKNYFGKGYSCAESLFMVSLRHLKQPEELFWIASGFGGGMYHRSLCGFLTAGIMAIGLRAGELKKEREEAKETCKQLVKRYWEWWTSQAPLDCSQIVKERTSYKVCVRLGLLSTAKVEELIGSV